MTFGLWVCEYVALFHRERKMNFCRIPGGGGERGGYNPESGGYRDAESPSADFGGGDGVDEFKDDGYSGVGDSPSNTGRSGRPVSAASNGSAGGLQQQKKKQATRKPIDLGAAANYAKSSAAPAQPAAAAATSSSGGPQLLDDLFSSVTASDSRPQQPRSTSALSGNFGDEDDDFNPRGNIGGGSDNANANSDTFGNFTGKSGNGGEFADFSSAFGNGNGNKATDNSGGDLGWVH